MSWWTELSPIDINYYDTKQLSSIITPYVSTELKQAPTQPLPQQSVKNFILSRYKAALDGFIKGLSIEGEIACRISQHQEFFEFEIDVCPFCANRFEKCRIMHGIFSGLLNWLDYRQKLLTGHSDLSIDIDRSTAHRIVLSFNL